MRADVLRPILLVIGVGAAAWLTRAAGAHPDPLRTLGLALDAFGGMLQVVAERVAALVLLGATLLYLSPKHQGIARRLAIAAVVSLCVAAIGPPLLHWMRGMLSTTVPLLLRGA